MATKSDFTSDEWKQVLKAPLWTSVVVVAASPSGPFGVVKEMFTAGKVLAEAKAKSGGNPIVDALVADLATPEGRKEAQPAEISGKSPDDVRNAALAALRQVASLVDRKAGADAEGFKRWLLSLSDRVAEASKEGGFLGIGGTRVSEQETAAMKGTPVS